MTDTRRAPDEQPVGADQETTPVPAGSAVDLAGPDRADRADRPDGPDGRPPEQAHDPPPERRRWWHRPAPEDLEQAKQSWREAMPWQHPMSGTDKLLVFATLGLVVLMLVTMPLRPLLLASHPVALSALTGSLSAVGAGAAFARIGEGPLWLVIAAGIFGMIKFDWLFWLAGRRWGPRIIEVWALGQVANRFVAWVRSWPAWAMPVAVVVAALPGVPAPAVFATAGLSGLRLVPFMAANAIGAGAMVGLVAGLGYGAGQHAVDVVLTIDRYAVWITVTLILALSARLAYRGYRSASA